MIGSISSNYVHRAFFGIAFKEMDQGSELGLSQGPTLQTHAYRPLRYSVLRFIMHMHLVRVCAANGPTMKVNVYQVGAYSPLNELHRHYIPILSLTSSSVGRCNAGAQP